MLATAYEKMDGNYGRWTIIREIDGESLRRAHEIFSNYKKRGVVLNESFEEDAWKLTNQAITVNLSWPVFEAAFHKHTMGWIGCGCRCFQDCAKAYVVFNLGALSLPALQELTRTLAALAGKTSEEAAMSKIHIDHIIRLLQIIPGGCEERDCVIEALEEKAEQSWNPDKGKQRKLADFNSYLRFNAILADFWRSADRRQKLFYFPVYFWWNLTAILPLRPMELLLTPRDCLENTTGGGSVLTVRRTKLKGGVRKIAYRIDEDYELKKYTISRALAQELRDYLSGTQMERGTEIATLFVLDPHFSYLHTTRAASRYYTFAYLNTCLSRFCKEAIEDRGMEPLRIRFGDTRHIAMASLIITGGSPVICKELAGHSDIDISSHYYSNISNLVECVTLERYRMSKGSAMSMAGIQRYPSAAIETGLRVEGGWCDAATVAAGDIGECLKAAGENGQIGDCACCAHYWPVDPGIRVSFFNEADGKHRVDADCQYLMRMVELARKGIGKTEDISAALLRLQQSSSHYSDCILEKYEKAGNT